VCEVVLAMALREALGASMGELMREDAITGGRMTRIFSTVGGVGVLLSRPFSSIHYALNEDHRNLQWGGLQISLTSQFTENTVDRYILMVF
jgi:hypothetical protein